MKLLIGIFLLGLTIQIAITKSLVKRDCGNCCDSYSNCDTPCTSSCNYRPSNNCNNRPCNSGCQQNQPCNNNREEPEVRDPVLVPFPQPGLQTGSNLPSISTVNNTNINNSTLELTLTNTINTVNNISVPITVNSTNENLISVYLTSPNEEADEVEKLDLCCIVISYFCDENNQNCIPQRRRECSDVCTGQKIEVIPTSTPRVVSTVLPPVTQKPIIPIIPPPIQPLPQPPIQPFPQPPFQPYPFIPFYPRPPIQDYPHPPMLVLPQPPIQIPYCQNPQPHPIYPIAPNTGGYQQQQQIVEPQPCQPVNQPITQVPGQFPIYPVIQPGSNCNYPQIWQQFGQYKAMQQQMSQLNYRSSQNNQNQLPTQTINVPYRVDQNGQQAMYYVPRVDLKGQQLMLPRYSPQDSQSQASAPFMYYPYQVDQNGGQGKYDYPFNQYQRVYRSTSQDNEENSLKQEENKEESL